MTFVKGQSGNPAGRPPGALNKRTMIAEGLLDDDAEKITRKAIDLALTGDPTALRLCVDRILPRGKNRPVPIALPPIETAADVRAAATEIMAGVCAGTLTPTEGSDLMRVVEAVARTLRLVDADARLARVEELLRAVTARLDEIDRPDEKNTSEKQAPPMRQEGARHPSPAGAATNTSKEQAEQQPANHPAHHVAPSQPPAGAPTNTRAEQADPPRGAGDFGPMPNGAVPRHMVDRLIAGAKNTSDLQAEWSPPSFETPSAAEIGDLTWSKEAA